ncbi:type IV pilus modification protein PilV [Thiobacillus sp.]|uniref:type IV pilus modification protein PilV n=1 Tax=Thiobacillus sp. TaxID=924 RepID=UPI001ACBDD4E|nr:type IV pilus modification protein PilV [Thiobacillus sp.]MBN8778069.1 type IV pilus modification protein PilV [Thiobacillus sp.]
MSLNKTQTGFTLLEILVAIVVLSLGLLGLAGLQAATLRNNQIAYFRAIAIQQTYDMADRIRANQAGVAAGKYNNPAATHHACAPCGSPQEMAEEDFYQWNNNNARMLPAGIGTVVNGANGSFIITIAWNENTETGSTGQQFVTRVVP